MIVSFFSPPYTNSIQVEFIVMGGTFMSMPEDYRGKFIAQLHNALSGFTGTDLDEAVRSVYLLRVSNTTTLSTPPGTPSEVNQKQLASPSKLDRTTAFARTSVKCYDTAAHVSKSAFSPSTKTSHATQTGGTLYVPSPSRSISPRTQGSKLSRI
jgi:hypothetical protein